MALLLGTFVLLGPGSCMRSDGPPRRSATGVGKKLVDGFIRSSGIAFAECRNSECLERAAAGCRPSHWARSFYTIEGTPAFLDYFVLHTDKGCQITAIGDYSEDYWGGCKVGKRVCPTVEGAMSDGHKGCSPLEILHAPRACPPPLILAGPLALGAAVAFGLGGLLCLLNSWLSFIRHPLHRLRHGPTAKLSNVSGIPLLGSAAVGLSLLVLHDRTWALAVGIPLCVLDTGGIHWAIGVSIWRRFSKNDAPHRPSNSAE